MSSLELGRLGERLARVHLESEGYRTITANFRSPYGEIDIIAEDTTLENPTLVFVEVKSRRTSRFGTPIQAVTPQKQKKMWLTAQYWLSQHLIGEMEPSCRFDIIEVFMGSSGQSKIVHHRAVPIHEAPAN